MPAIDVVLPLPPSTNNLYVNVPKVGRVRSKRYKAWIDEAGRAPIAGAWQRFSGEARNGIPWRLIVTVYGLRANADITNLIKPLEDLVCAMTGLEDCNTVEVIARKAGLGALKDPCVMVWVNTMDEAA